MNGTPKMQELKQESDVFLSRGISRGGGVALPSSACGFPLESKATAPISTVTRVWSMSDSILKVKHSANLDTRVNPDPDPTPSPGQARGHARGTLG